MRRVESLVNEETFYFASTIGAVGIAPGIPDVIFSSQADNGPGVHGRVSRKRVSDSFSRGACVHRR